MIFQFGPKFKKYVQKGLLSLACNTLDGMGEWDKQDEGEES
jgi:hypothetical protein